MPHTLNLGSINIKDKEVAHFIENKSIDELKNMIIAFLKNQVEVPTEKNQSKGKWEAFADRMSGLTSPDITEHIHKTNLEMKEDFSLREVKK